MRDSDCVQFLQWALPTLRMRWSGFRRVRRQVCKRIARRLAELGCRDLDAYRALLSTDSAEWNRLDSLCCITISRFYRDRAVWDHMGDVLLPELAGLVQQRGDTELRCLSVGCASGEEPYTLAMIWRSGVSEAKSLPLRILAVDADEKLLDRARDGLYEESSLRDVPDGLRACFAAEGAMYRIHPLVQAPVTFLRQDLRVELPAERFHLLLCRNLVFTYYDESLQRVLLDRLLRRLIPGGALVIGIHERLPGQPTAVSVRDASLGIYLKNTTRSSG